MVATDLSVATPDAAHIAADTDLTVAGSDAAATSVSGSSTTHSLQDGPFAASLNRDFSFFMADSSNQTPNGNDKTELAPTRRLFISKTDQCSWNSITLTLIG